MGDFMMDVNAYYHPSINAVGGLPAINGKDKSKLDMTDFLTLMVKEMTSQSIDSTMDTADMLNQLVQMQMVQALTSMTDASVMSYSASLVGKEVTIGQLDDKGQLTELVGTVKGTGMMDGKQVIFLDNDKYYDLSQIMAVGRLPARADQVEKPQESEKPAEKPQESEEPLDPAEL